MNFLQVYILIFSFLCPAKSQIPPDNDTFPPEVQFDDPTPRDCPSNTMQESRRLVNLKFPHKVLPDSHAFIITHNHIITLASYIALENVYMISANCIRMTSKVAARLYAQRRIAHPQYANTRRSFDIAIIIVDNTTGFEDNFAVATDRDMFTKDTSCFLLNENVSHPVSISIGPHTEHGPPTTYIGGSNASGVILCCGKLLGFTLPDVPAQGTLQRIQTFTKLHDFIKAPEFYAPYIDGLTDAGAILIFSAASIGFSIAFQFMFN